MIGKTRFTLLMVLCFSVFAPLTSAFAEVPFLRWERGQVQEVVLGGVAAQNKWKIQLQGEGVESLDFTESIKASGDYIVFTLMVPKDHPVGPYTILALKPGGETKVIAAVQMLGVETYKVTRVPRDLAFIIGILIFVTAFTSTLRARKYSEMSFLSTQQLYQEAVVRGEEGKSVIQKITDLPYNIRTRAISNFNTSLFKFLMLREGEFLHRISKQLYALLPIVGFGGGIIAANETTKAGGIASASLAVFIAMALISILDAYSGVLAILGFWFFQLSLGNVSSFRDILLMLAVGIGWLGPILAFAVGSSAISRDFVTSTRVKPNPASQAMGIIFGALFGASIFYLSHKLINSILIEIKAQREISALALGIVIVALIIRGFAEQTLLGRQGSQSPLESITIARINSPQTAFAVLIMTFGFTYLWTSSSQSSLIAACLFSSPYLLLLVRFDKFRITFLARIPRNILVESVIVTAVGFYIFREVSSMPFLVGERARKFLLLAGVPGIVHAIYSIACDSANRVEAMRK